MEIHFQHYKTLQLIYRWHHRNIHRMTKYNVRTIYRHSTKNQIILYGYDGLPKWHKNNLSNPDSIFRIIEEMPMSRFDKVRDNNDILYEMCGLPHIQITNHCFADTTHLTCCMLGGEARRYADQSGNPIGTAAETAFSRYYGFYPSYDTLTPWCTCIGSGVCSYYTKRFNDGTHIKFIDHDGNILLTDNEKTFKKYSHKTPGIPDQFAPG